MSKGVIASSRAEIEVLCENSSSIAEILRALKIKESSANYRTLYKYVEEWGLILPKYESTTGRRRRASPLKKSTESLLVKGLLTNSTRLKERLISEGFLEEKCAAPFCPLPSMTLNPFTGETVRLKLALDHINGDHTDNRIENLRLLCYHCHGMTETYCRGTQKRTPRGKKKYYCECGKEKDKNARNCLACYNQKREVIVWPKDEELKLLLKNNNYSAVGKMLGVSDNAIRKRVRKYNINLP